MSDEDFETLIDLVDNDKSGCIDYNEFVEDLKSQDMQTGGFLGGNKPVASKKAPAEVSFSHPTPTTSTGASGRSGRSILQQIAEKVEQKAKNVRVVFRNFDVDNDKSGCIDYNEFVEDLKSQDMQTGGFLGGGKNRPKSQGGFLAIDGQGL